MAINRRYWQWIEQAITAFWSQKPMTTCLSIGFGGLLASSVAPQFCHPDCMFIWNRIEFMQIWQNLSKTHIYAESAWPALLLIPTLVSTFLLDTFALIPSNVVLGRWCWHWCWYWYKAGENSKKYDPSSKQTLISHYPEQSFNFNFNIKMFD